MISFPLEGRSSLLGMVEVIETESWNRGSRRITLKNDSNTANIPKNFTIPLPEAREKNPEQPP
ncbi:hypothetical protein NOC27_961 [Nitrosococcus oceani AFC27]|nr:hypothetical protein NOC27_961 [Nitrosococcus oceani AFC27]